VEKAGGSEAGGPAVLTVTANRSRYTARELKAGSRELTPLQRSWEG
jgi:hypothetical protein